MTVWEMSVMENNEKAKIMIFHPQLLFIIDIQYLHMNTCFCKWYILMN